jgi:hypothetical protein
MKITRIIFATLLLVIFAMTSCQQKPGQKKSSDVEAVESDEFSEKLVSINPGLRDPSVVMVALDMAGADYLDGLVNPMENVEFYATDEARAALALGVYTVDIAYLVAYGKREAALNKYERARKLSKAIGLQSTYEDGMFQRYINAGADPDSLMQLLTLTAENVDQELTKAERARHGTLFVTGEFIEKMYILTQVIARYPADLPEDARSQLLRHLMIAVANQKESLDNLIDLLNQIREEDEGERFMAEMSKLKQVYVEANFREMVANWTPETKPTGEYLTRITDQVAKLRAGLVATGEE